ncbi:TPA: hypothetical protein JA361_00080 [Legionella pneumophila]|nr:hypothetical protein [Legionella pneumophila]HAT8181534.1 hypothetical protein [Legionella pneumophila]
MYIQEQKLMDYKQLYEVLWNAGIFVLSGAVGATIVVIINHFKQKHDHRVQLENDIYALFCKFFFISSLQYSELINKKKEVEDKLSKLKKLTHSTPKQDLVYIVQDFDYDQTINISTDDLSNALFKLKSMKSYQSGDAQMLQPFYLLNDKYHEIINHFAMFNEMKRNVREWAVTAKQEEHIKDYFREYMPVALEKIDRELAFINSTLNSCDELFKKLGRTRPLKFGGVVAL